jgi:hypothetical protein
MKQEASGWLEWCQSQTDKWRYIRDYHEKEGILLDYNNIKNNPGLPSVTISWCPMGIFPVLLIYGYREVASTYDISWSF